MGSPAYIAPERARGRTAGPASDLWSLGVTLYAMLDGRSPFERPEPMASLVAVISDDPPPAPNAGPLTPVIEGLLRKDPDERMSAPEAGMLLDEIVREESADAQYTRPVLPPSDEPGTLAEVYEPAGEAGHSHPAQRAQEVAAIGDDVPGDPAETVADAVSPAVSPRAASATSDPEATVLDEAGLGTVPPGGDTAPAGRPAGGDGRRRSVPRILVGVVVVVLLLAISAMAVAMSRDDKPSSKPGGALTVRVTPGPTLSPTMTLTASVSPSADSPGSGGVPEGFRRYEDRTGFVVAVPEDWEGPSRRDSSVFFHSPDRDSYVQIDQADDPGSSALKDWEDLEAATKGSRFPGYERLRLEPTGDQPPVRDTGDGDRSADWEFTWNSGSTRMHGLNRGFVAGGRGYAIFLVAPDDEWKKTRADMEPVFQHFEPAD
jgi:hypothetical protein